MKELTNIERANESNWLWPSIADAVDTFIRRRENADAYENIWRLIHIWEAVATSLSGAVACCLRQDGEASANLYLKMREHLYGVVFDKIDKQIKTGQGAFDGSNDKRIEVLRVIQKAEVLPSGFLDRVKRFLNYPEGDDGDNCDHKEAIIRSAARSATSDLLEVWKRVCDVPTSTEQAKSFKVIHLIGLVNTFRNRYAHVPFPYDPVSSLAESLEQLTEALFSVQPSPWTHDSVLAGGIVQGETLWRGCLTCRWRGEPYNEAHFVFPVFKPTEEWPAGPFVFIDANKRPYVLTRLKDRETGAWEYTRYRAEANSVIGCDSENLLSWISAPVESEYEQPEDALAEQPLKETEATSTEQSDEQPRTAEFVEDADRAKREVNSFQEAIEAIRSGEFGEAIPFLERLVRERPIYHIGWLRLGYAQRELAARLPGDQKQEALALLGEAVQSFSQAGGHVDIDYKASALYERSKAYYRKYVIAGEKQDAELAYDDAKEACKMSTESQFQSWIEYLERAIAQSL